MKNGTISECKLSKALDIIEDPPSHVTFKRQNAQKWYFHMG
jgi:hypothetical protein